MAEMAWQSALLVTVLLILDRVYRRRSARFLHAVWLLILIRLVIPPATSFPTGIGWWVRPATTQTVSANDTATDGTATNDVPVLDREKLRHTALERIDRGTAARRPSMSRLHQPTAIHRPRPFPGLRLPFWFGVRS